MSEQETKQRRPFHESVIIAIDQAPSRNEMWCLANLIKMTKIPKGHDEIIEAWNQRRQEMGMVLDELDYGVPTDLLEQKQEAERQEEEKKATTEKVLADLRESNKKLTGL